MLFLLSRVDPRAMPYARPCLSPFQPEVLQEGQDFTLSSHEDGKSDLVPCLHAPTRQGCIPEHMSCFHTVRSPYYTHCFCECVHFPYQIPLAVVRTRSRNGNRTKMEWKMKWIIERKIECKMERKMECEMENGNGNGRWDRRDGEEEAF